MSFQSMKKILDEWSRRLNEFIPGSTLAFRHVIATREFSITASVDNVSATKSVCAFKVASCCNLNEMRHLVDMNMKSIIQDLGERRKKNE